MSPAALTSFPGRRSVFPRAVAAAFVLAASLLIAVPAHAASTYYVGPVSGCSESGSGTSVTPFCTITKAASLAKNAGDTVIVRSGTYLGTVAVGGSGSSSARIVFRADSGATPVVSTNSGPGFKVSAKSYVTIQGFKIQNTAAAGILVTGSPNSNISIIGNDVSGAGSPASNPQPAGASTNTQAAGMNIAACSNCLVDSNKTHDNNDHGIYITSGTTNSTIIHNESWNNWRPGTARAAAGISLQKATNNVVEANRAHGNEDTGIQCRTGANNNIVVNNLSYFNHNHGYDTLDATGVRYLNDVAYANDWDGFSLEGKSGSFNATLRNNISVNNNAGDNSRFDLWISPSSQPGTTVDYDIIWRSGPGAPIKWGGTKYTSITAFKATGQEAHGTGADPKFVAPDASTFDYHLQSGSPAIDSADASASGWRATDFDGKARVDDRGTPNAGAGSPDYSDRGALEFLGTSTSTNHPPTANNDTATVVQNSSNNTISVLTNDTDPDSDPLTVAAVTQPSHGSVTFGATSVAYTPTTDYVGTDSFTYTASDGRGGTSTATVSVTVDGKPVANADTWTVQQGSSNNLIPVLSNDTDPDSDPLSLSSVGPAAHGTTAVSGSQASYTPTPTTYTGSDAFTYVVSDGRGGTATGTVNVTVNAPPSVTNDTATVDANSSNNAIDVLANDTDPNNDTLTISNVGTPTHGSVTISNNKVSYTTTGYSGSDSFTYTASDGKGGSAGGTVSVTVRNNTAPTANPDSANVVQGASKSINVLGNDTDPDNDTLTITATTNGAIGTTSIDTKGTTSPSDDLVVYTSNGTSGIDTFTYSISDGHGGTAMGTVTVTVGANSSPVANPDTPTVRQNSTGNLIDVLANDTDPDGDTLTLDSITQFPTNGSASIANGKVSYTPTAGYSGPDTLKYQVSDSHGGTAPGTVNITVAADQQPVANADTATVSAGASTSINVLANDTDADNDPLTITSTGNPTAPAHGSATIDTKGTPAPGDDVITYTSTDTTFTGNDTFSYSISDGFGGTATGTVTVTVSGAANLVANPGFESGTTGWRAPSAGTSLTWQHTDTTLAHTGIGSAVVTNTTGATLSPDCRLGEVVNTVDPTASTGSYTISIWVRSTANAGKVFKLRVKEYSGQPTLSAVTQTTLTTSWQQVSLTYTPTYGGSSSLEAQFYVGSAAAGDCFTADDVSITRS